MQYKYNPSPQLSTLAVNATHSCDWLLSHSPRGALSLYTTLKPRRKVNSVKNRKQWRYLNSKKNSVCVCVCVYKEKSMRLVKGRTNYHMVRKLRRKVNLWNKRNNFSTFVKLYSNEKVISTFLQENLFSLYNLMQLKNSIICHKNNHWKQIKKWDLVVTSNENHWIIHVINFIKSTLHDVFVYKAGVFTYFFLT